MKILITVYDGAIAKNILRTDVLRLLRADGNNQIVLLVHPQKVAYYAEQFPFADVHCLGGYAGPAAIRETLFALLCVNSIPTRSLRMWQRTRYREKKKWLIFGAATLVRLLGRYRWWRSLLRLCDRWLVPTPQFYHHLLREEKPDVVFATNMISRDDTALLRIAPHYGIRTIGMIKSWDNPTTKSFIRHLPDRIIVQTDLQKNEIVQLFDVPAERVFVTGLPQYDRWLDPALVIPRDSFFASFGLDPAKKLIVYAAAGDWMQPGEDEIVQLIADAIARGEFGPAQLLVRLHPKYVSATERLQVPDVVIRRPGTRISDSLGLWEYEEADTKELVSTLVWADVTLNTASTFSIDAAIIDRPIVLIAFDGVSASLPYDRSVVRYYDREHMRQIVESGGARLVRSPAACIEAIAQYIQTPSLDAEGRQRIRDAQCYRLDGKSSERLVQCIVGLREDVHK